MVELFVIFYGRNIILHFFIIVERFLSEPGSSSNNFYVSLGVLEGFRSLLFPLLRRLL